MRFPVPLLQLLLTDEARERNQQAREVLDDVRDRLTDNPSPHTIAAEVFDAHDWKAQAEEVAALTDWAPQERTDRKARRARKFAKNRRTKR